MQLDQGLVRGRRLRLRQPVDERPLHHFGVGAGRAADQLPAGLGRPGRRTARIVRHRGAADSGPTQEVIDRRLELHVLVDGAGPIARKADVPSLVLSHIEDRADAINTRMRTDLAQRGHDGQVTIGRDLVGIPVRGR